MRIKLTRPSIDSPGNLYYNNGYTRMRIIMRMGGFARKVNKGFTLVYTMVESTLLLQRHARNSRLTETPLGNLRYGEAY